LKEPYCYEEINGKPVRMQLINPDMWKWNRAENLHISLRSLLAFTAKHDGNLPTAADADEMVEIATAFMKADKESELKDAVKLDELQEDIVRNVASFARSQICPIASFLGGVVAQEVVKFTGKFSPLKQWLHVEWFEALPTGDVNRELCNDRYDEMRSIFGRDIVDKLRASKYFLVGCGALGCEYIK